MASARRSVSSRSAVTSPTIRIAEARTRERLARNDFLGQPEFASHRADLVLEQQPQRLDEFELQVVGQAADVVVALDVRRARSAAGLDDVGVQRALDEELDGRRPELTQLLRHHFRDGALEAADELAADDLALALGVGSPRQLAEELVRGVDGEELRAGRGDEVALHLLALAGAQQSVVDEHTGQPVADGALHQGGGDRGVDAAGQPADRPAVADLGAHLLDEGVGDVGGCPCRVDAGEFVQEPAEHLLAVRGVHHLGVVLDAGQAARRVLERRDRRARAGGR